jgi:hypothetical protein
MTRPSPFIRVCEAFEGRHGPAETLELLKAMCDLMAQPRDLVEAWEDGPYPPQIRPRPPQETVQGLGEVESTDGLGNKHRVLVSPVGPLEHIPVKYPKGCPRGWR